MSLVGEIFDISREDALRLGVDTRKLFEIGGYRLVKLSKARSWTRWKRCQDLAEDEFEYSSGIVTADVQNRYFISHRWLDPTHPDPEGTQLERVKRLQDDDALLLYDFCSLPQEGRDATEQYVFDMCLKNLNKVISNMKVVVLDDEEYMSRSWCLMEYFISAFGGSIICDEVQDARMANLQSLANTMDAGLGNNPKSADAAFEAGRAEKMGEVARWFFNVYKHSKVTKGTDHKKIDGVFRKFVAEEVRFWDYIPYVGWQPRPLSAEETEKMLQGEKVELIGVSSIESSFEEPPSVTIPRSLEDDLKGYWGPNYFNRLMTKMNRYYRLNDASAKTLIGHDLPQPEEAARDVWERKQRLLGDDDPNTLASMNDLALVLKKQGKPSEATEVLREVVNARQKVLGDDHPDTLASMHSLAMLIMGQKKNLGEAEVMLRNVLEGRRKALGEHKDTLTTMSNLAVILKEQGKLDESLKLMREMLEGSRGTLGEDHPDTLAAMHNLATNLSDNGEPDEAILMMQETLKMKQKALGETHPDTMLTMNNLALTLLEQARHDEAADLLQKILEIKFLSGMENVSEGQSANNRTNVGDAINPMRTASGHSRSITLGDSSLEDEPSAKSRSLGFNNGVTLAFAGVGFLIAFFVFSPVGIITRAKKAIGFT